MNKKIESKPPESTRWIFSRRDLPPRRGSARFEVYTANGDRKNVILSNRKRQVVDALIRNPIYCASPVRLSDIVMLLRSEDGLGVETVYFQESDGIEKTRFGVYKLTDQVHYLGEISSVTRDSGSSEVKA
ncbi:hypothetical protein [Roseovarius sp.]|uniref:hypothetical protein n=1 Tax=Roseovarius sp. TaxID=1486281 RepID=UPI003A96DD40